MAKGDHSYDLRLLRNAFADCRKDLIESTDFDVMYDKLNSTDIGKKRMSCIFVLRAYSGGEVDRRSSLLHNAIGKETDEDFVHWFDAITSALSQTGNENNGKHQEVLEKIWGILQDSKSKRTMSCSRVPKKVTVIKQHKDIKVILLGRSGSGKSRFFQCALGNTVKETTITVGMDLGILEFQYDQDTAVKLSIWDTGGQERFEAITQNYYRGCNGALIFVDLVQFNKTDKREGLILYTENLIKDLKFRIGKKSPCLLVGAKYDLVGQLSDEDIKAFKKLADYCADGQWICTSAKTGFNVQDALSVIMELVMDKMSQEQDAGYNTQRDTLRLSDNPQPSNPRRGVWDFIRRRC